MKGSTLAKNSETAARRTAGAAADAACRASRDELVAAYRLMLLSRRLDDKEIQLKNQSLIFFQISGAGPRGRVRGGGRAPQGRLRLVLPLLPRPRAVPRPRHDAARDAAGRGRRQGRSELGRTADAVALGPPRAQHSLAGQPYRHAVPSGGRLRRGRHDLRPRDRDCRRPGEATGRRSDLRVDRRRRDE